MLKRLILLIFFSYIFGVLIFLYISFDTTKQEKEDYLVAHYKEHFRIVEVFFDNYFEEIKNDLDSLVLNETVKIKDDSNFTSFLNADENTFVYNYSEKEKEIIELFNNVLVSHPNMNSVYMGRENGSFVRAVPRTLPTKYDPRQRPWYKSAMEHPGSIQMTSAYSSLTNDDINIAVATTLQDENNRPYGVVGIDVTIKKLSEEMKKQRLSFDGYMELVDSEGKIIISPVEEHLNQMMKEGTSYEFYETIEGLKIDKNGEFYRITHNTELFGGLLIAYVPQKKLDDYFLAKFKERLLWSLGVLVVIGIWSIFLINNFINKPIAEMLRELEKTQKRGVPSKIYLNSKGEFLHFQNKYNELVDNINKDEEELKRIRDLTVSSLSSLTSMRDYETGLHLIRTSKYVEIISEEYNRQYPEKTINLRKIELMVQCAPLHDIGKVAIPDYILQKPGKLTPLEFEEMKKHIHYGKRALENIIKETENQLFIETAVNMIYHHHERWDGKGYPDGLKGEFIPIEARIMAIADAYDAITSSRVYQEARSHEEAAAIVEEMRGTQFDPEIVEVFFIVENNIRAVAETYSE